MKDFYRYKFCECILMEKEAIQADFGMIVESAEPLRLSAITAICQSLPYDYVVVVMNQPLSWEQKAHVYDNTEEEYVEHYEGYEPSWELPGEIRYALTADIEKKVAHFRTMGYRPAEIVVTPDAYKRLSLEHGSDEKFKKFFGLSVVIATFLQDADFEIICHTGGQR